MARVNSDLIGKFVNIASRSAGFIAKKFDGKIASQWATGADPFLATLRSAAGEIQALYDHREFGKALRAVMDQADIVNAYVDANKPWELAKDAANNDKLHEVCSRLLEAFRILTIFPEAGIAGIGETGRSPAEPGADAMGGRTASVAARPPGQCLCTPDAAG
ncbi:hypothetical protein ACFS07_23125 [Undibacterium arcticum]